MPRPATHRRTVLRRRIVALVLVAGALGGGIAAARSTSGAAARPAAGTATPPTTLPAAQTTGSRPTTAPATTGPLHAGRPVTIEWVGDTVLASSYGMPPDGGRRSLDRVAGQLRAADLTWGNLEETMSTATGSKCAAGAANCFAFQAPPAMARVLQSAGFDVLNMANNHAFDYGALGRRQTVASLARMHLRSTGAPGQITLVRRNGTTVAFLGFAPYPWAARLDRIPAAVALVRRAAQVADLVVVAIHAGAEGSGATHVPRGTEFFLGENRGDSRAFAHAVTDAGADLVVGSGPHVLRGVELYHGHLIAYSLGNFAGFRNFGMGGDLSLSGILRVTLQPDGGWTAARLIALRLQGEGLPALDPSNASVRLVARLSREDFGTHAARFSPDGTIER